MLLIALLPALQVTLSIKCLLHLQPSILSFIHGKHFLMALVQLKIGLFLHLSMYLFYLSFCFFIASEYTPVRYKAILYWLLLQNWKRGKMLNVNSRFLVWTLKIIAYLWCRYEYFYGLVRDFPDLTFTINGGINSVEEVMSLIFLMWICVYLDGYFERGCPIIWGYLCVCSLDAIAK